VSIVYARKAIGATVMVTLEGDDQGGAAVAEKARQTMAARP